MFAFIMFHVTTIQQRDLPVWLHVVYIWYIYVYVMSLWKKRHSNTSFFKQTSAWAMTSQNNNLTDPTKEWKPRAFLTRLPLGKMAAISQTTHSNAFLWMETLVIWFKLHWRLFRKGLIDNKPALIQVMAWHRTGDSKLINTLNMVNCSQDYRDVFTFWIVSWISFDPRRRINSGTKIHVVCPTQPYLLVHRRL